MCLFYFFSSHGQIALRFIDARYRFYSHQPPPPLQAPLPKGGMSRMRQGDSVRTYKVLIFPYKARYRFCCVRPTSRPFFSLPCARGGGTAQAVTEGLFGETFPTFTPPQSAMYRVLIHKKRPSPIGEGRSLFSEVFHNLFHLGADPLISVVEHLLPNLNLNFGHIQTTQPAFPYGLLRDVIGQICHPHALLR